MMDSRTHNSGRRKFATALRRNFESLESRVLLAADLIAAWSGDDLATTVDDGSTLTSWSDAGNSVTATANGRLIENRLNGHAAVKFGEADYFRISADAGGHSILRREHAPEAATALTESLLNKYVNCPPNTTEDSYTTVEDSTLAVTIADGLLANDIDLEGDAITVSVASQPAHGSVMLEPDGSFNYSPRPDFFGIDRFDYVASDGQKSASTAVTIEVKNQFDAISADAGFSIRAISGATSPRHILHPALIDSATSGTVERTVSTMTLAIG